MITTSYGTWTSRVDPYSLSVEQTVREALGDYADQYDVDAIAADYRQAINQALPEGVSLCGDEFIGPYHSDDATWGPELETEGRLNIRVIVESVDFWGIVAKHEITAES